jgi:hypothetical protein
MNHPLSSWLVILMTLRRFLLDEDLNYSVRINIRIYVTMYMAPESVAPRLSMSDIDHISILPLTAYVLQQSTLVSPSEYP